MGDRSLQDLTRLAVELARRKGAQGAAAGASRARTVSVQWRDGQVEKLTEATTRAVGLELYVDGRYGSVGTSDLRPEALERFVEDAVALVRKVATDPFRQLPDPELQQGATTRDLELEDPSYGKVDAVERRRLAAAAEAGARETKGAERILSCTTGFSDTLLESFRVHSSGFEAGRRATDFWVSAEVSAKDPDGRRPEDWSAAGGRFFAAVPRPEEVGRVAAERTLARIGSRKGESAVLPMVVENRAAGRLVGFLLGPLAASALQQKRSFLDAKLGQKIGSERLTIGDEPHVPRGLGSRRYDGEGLAARPFPVFEKGVLRTYYVDTYYGRKLGMPPTTRAMSNLAWAPGDAGRDGLVARVGEGVLVTGFLGGNSNGTTGDFSLGAQGFRIRGGKLAEPVGEMNVSGNHLELWARLAEVGNDPYAYSASRTPTLVFDGVQFAGL
jgi:PmbA protein